MLPRTRYYVKITVRDNAGGSASADTWFETGKMDKPWEAKWIGTDILAPFLNDYRFALQTQTYDMTELLREA